MAGMVDKELAIELMKFVQFVQTNLLPIYEQKHIGELGKDFFCVDWWAIEVCKCLFNGIDMYLEDPPPWRLRDNKNFDKQKIIEDAKNRLETIELLEENKNIADRITIVNAERGIELVLANHIKKWECIHCIEDNPKYEHFLNLYFKEKLGMNLKFKGKDEPPIDSLLIQPECSFFDGTTS